MVVLSNAFTLLGVDDIGIHLLNPRLPLAKPEPPKQHTEINIDPKLLDNYTGRYQLTPNLTFEITRDGDCLFAQVTGQHKFEVFAEGEKNFFARVSDKQIGFGTGPRGPCHEPCSVPSGPRTHARRAIILIPASI